MKMFFKSNQHLADNAMSKPVMVSVILKRPCCSCWPQSMDTDFWPNFAVLVYAIKASKKIEEAQTWYEHEQCKFDKQEKSSNLC